jgi:hypothetical protein
MAAAAPGRILLFNLDDYVKYRLRYIEDGIITPLGLHLEKNHKRRLERMSAKNRTEQDLNVPRRQSLTIKEQHFIRTHSELEREFEKLSLSDDYTRHTLS